MAGKKSQSDKALQEELKKSGDIPTHIAIIMDGNGRWAKKRGLPRVAGHRRGVETVREIVETCAEIGVKYLTLYTFSTENWKRPKDEVSTLMRLLLKSLKDRLDELKTISNLPVLGTSSRCLPSYKDSFLKILKEQRITRG